MIKHGDKMVAEVEMRKHVAEDSGKAVFVSEMLHAFLNYYW